MTENSISGEKNVRVVPTDVQNSTIPVSRFEKFRLTAGNPGHHSNTLDAYLPKVKSTGSGRILVSSKPQKSHSGCPSTKAAGNHKIVKHEVESKISSNGKDPNFNSKMIYPLISVSEREGKVTPTKTQLTQSAGMEHKSSYGCSQPQNFTSSSLCGLLNSQTSTMNLTKNVVSCKTSYQSSQVVQLSNSSSQTQKLDLEEVQEFIRTNGVRQRPTPIKSRKFYLQSCRSDETFTYSL